MHPGIIKKTVLIPGSALVFFFLLGGCAVKQPEASSDKVPSQPEQSQKMVDNFLKTEPSLKQRIGRIPKYALKHIQQLDRQPHYSRYSPTNQEHKIILDMIGRLPTTYQKTLKKKVIGIYFINDFYGNGFTQLLSAENDEYYYLIFDANVLQKNMSQLLTSKIAKIFPPDRLNKYIETHNVPPVQITTGKSSPGLLFILLHEMSHVYDYEHQMTPYVGPRIKRIKQLTNQPTPFTKNVWSGTKPVSKYNYPLRDQINFFYRGQSKIDPSRAVELYKQLRKTPFVSVYGSTSREEDFAEFATFYHLTQKLHQSYRIRVHRPGKTPLVYRPMESPRVQKRFTENTLSKIYPDNNRESRQTTKNHE